MANTTITNLPLAIALTGTEQLPAVQSTTTVRLTVSQIATYTSSTMAAPVVTIGGTVSGGTPGNGLYVSSSGTLADFPYGAGIFNAIQIAAGSNGSPVLFNGAGGTPTSLTLTLGSISISGATNGYLLYNNNGSLGAVSPTAASISIGSLISGGTSGYGLYVNDASTQLAQFAYGTGVRTALGVNVGSAGAPVLFNGAGGLPSSIDLTNGTNLPISAGTTGNLPVSRLNSGTGASASTYWRGDGTWASVSGGSGTVTSVSFTGGIISVATPTSTPALTVFGTQGGIPYFSSGTAWTSSGALALNSLVIGGGTGAPTTTTTGTGVLTALGNATNAASGIAVKDANANLSSNNVFETLTTITAAGGVTTLTAASAFSYVINGSGGQTIQLPDATTLPVGAVYRFNNNQSSGTVTIRNNSATTIVTLQSGSANEVTLLVNSPAAGTWDTHTLAPSNASWSTNTLTWAGTIGSGGAGSTWNAVPITVPYGGTGVTTSALGSIVVGSGSNTTTNLAIGSTNQILTVSGGTAAWASAIAPTTVNNLTLAALSTGFTVAGGTTSKTLTVSSTLTLAGVDAKTLTVNNSLTLAGTDSTTMTFPPASASIGYLEIPQNSQGGNYTLVLADSGKHIYTTALATITIPANGTVAFPIGTAVTFINSSASATTIAITTDTMRLSPAGTTGSRTLAQYGMATAVKVTSTIWYISGTGLT